MHIVANFPDGVFQQNTTDAVKNLLDATSQSFDHFIVSISRTMDPRKEYVVHGEGMISISYLGLPAAIGQSFFLRRLAQRIEKELVSIDLEFDIIHGHKLTVEALISYYLTLKIKIPYVCTIRGLTDGRILRWRPDRRSLYAKVLKKTSTVFLPAPWTRKLIFQFLESAGSHDWLYQVNYSILPNIVQFSKLEKNVDIARKSRYITVFREGHGKRKGFPELLKSLIAAKSKQKKIYLDVIGCGTESREAILTKDLGISDQVTFLGKFENSETVNRVAQYRGFILPTRNDTFGMVYTEALLAGVPVLYSGGTGIDGHLDNLDVGVRVDPFDQNSIDNGILLFDEQADYLRTRLKLLLEEGGLDFFSQNSVASEYSRSIKRCLEHNR